MTEIGPRPVVLAIDSAGSSCSVAVGAGKEILAEKRVDTLYAQAETLLPLVDSAMREAGQAPAALSLIAATVGPGSFTGIRVGLAAARAIALATGVRLIGVTSFDAVAAEAARSSCSEGFCLLVALESRREDLYIQFFGGRGDALGEPAAVMPFALGEAANAAVGGMPLLIAGDAAQRAAVALARRPHIAVLDSSAAGAVGALLAGLRLLRVGKADNLPKPLYLRPPDVTIAGQPRKPSPVRA